MQTHNLEQIIRKAWSDANFKRRLLTNPRAVAEEHGISIPNGIEIRVVENTDTIVHFILPAKPPAELSDEQLDRVAGGFQSSPRAKDQY